MYLVKHREFPKKKHFSMRRFVTVRQSEIYSTRIYVQAYMTTVLSIISIFAVDGYTTSDGHHYFYKLLFNFNCLCKGNHASRTEQILCIFLTQVFKILYTCVNFYMMIQPQVMLLNILNIIPNNFLLRQLHLAIIL